MDGVATPALLQLPSHLEEFFFFPRRCQLTQFGLCVALHLDHGDEASDDHCCEDTVPEFNIMADPGVPVTISLVENRQLPSTLVLDTPSILVVSDDTIRTATTSDASF